MKVLIVEDDPSTLLLLKKIVNDIGYLDILANSAELALEVFKINHDIDLVITDVVMNKMSGLEFVHEIRQDSNNKNVPVFVCSSKLTRDEVMSYLKEGIQLFMEKPVKSKTLQAHMIKLLEPDLAKTHYIFDEVKP